MSFHDGTPFDATAVKANLDRLGDRKNALMCRCMLNPYSGLEVLTADHLRVRLKRSFAPFLRNLPMTQLAMVSPAAVARHGKLFGQHPVGTGPFRFVSMKPGEEVRLERNPHYA